MTELDETPSIEDTTKTLDESLAYVPPEEEKLSAHEIVFRASQNVSNYTPDQKLHAVLVYFLNQSRDKTAKICRIPEGTIKHWMQTVWWKDAYQSIKREKNEELDGKISAILDKSINLIAQRLKKGDATVAKDGSIVYKPVAARDIAMISAILFDKRALMRGDPTSRTEKVSTEEVLSNLMESFKKLADKVAKPRREEKVINPKNIETASIEVLEHVTVSEK